jgi:hypothetical protein
LRFLKVGGATYFRLNKFLEKTERNDSHCRSSLFFLLSRLVGWLQDHNFLREWKGGLRNFECTGVSFFNVWFIL